MKRLRAGLLTLLLAPLGTALAQPQQAPAPSDQQQAPSLGDVARAAREQKKAETKTPKVWNNENIAEASGQISVVGQAPGTEAAPEKPAAAEGQPPAAPEKEKAAGAAAESKDVLEKQLADAKDQLAGLKTDLDILLRKYTLDRQMYYSKPDYASDKAGAAALDDEKNQVDSKQQEVNQAQQKVDELQQKLDALNPAGPGNPL